MKQSDIQVGKSYINRGKGMVLRRVVDMIFGKPRTQVRYITLDITGNQNTTYNDTCYLDQFAKWAGREVEI
jgi:hypothetical protein